jgi:uncharacterized protein (TIGR03086 family)
LIDPDLYRRALEATGHTVAGVRPDQLAASTPCAAWDVRTLLNHVIGGNLTFARIAAGGTADAAGDMPDLTRPDPGTNYLDSAEAVLAAWAEPGALDRRCHMPFGDLPAPAAMALHFLDCVVHGWDLARATGQPTALDPELAGAALSLAQGMVTPELRQAGVFGPEVPCPGDAPVHERLVAFLGREP